MRQAANIVPFPTFVPLYRRWRRDLESARCGLGVRCHTGHVSDAQWRRHWAQGLEPVTAVVQELELAE